MQTALMEGMKSVPALVVILIFLGWALRLVTTAVRAIVTQWLGTLKDIGDNCHDHSEAREERMKITQDGMTEAMKVCSDSRVALQGTLGQVEATMRETNRLLARANGGGVKG